MEWVSVKKEGAVEAEGVKPKHHKQPEFLK